MLTITESAAKQIAEQAKQTDTENLVLRIAAKTNKDGSFDYGIGFDEIKEDDLKTNQYKVDVIIDPQSAELLDEATMDYVELEKSQYHFIFLNPLDPNYTLPRKNK